MQVGQRVAIAGMAISGALAVIKIIAGTTGHSTAVVADGLESVGDVIASGFVLLGLTLAAKPADSNHPYGHGRVEILTGLMIGIILTAAGVLIAYRSISEIGFSHPEVAGFVIWPLIASAITKAGLSGMKFYYGRRIKSAALMADAWNDSVDILSALTALLAVGLTLWRPDHFINADHYGGAAVGVIVILTGLRVSRETAYQLMDTMPDDTVIDEIRGVAITVPGVLGIEKCFARKTGLKYHVDLHVEVDPEITVRESHQIGHNTQIKLKDTLDWVADVLVHVEPAPDLNDLPRSTSERSRA